MPGARELSTLRRRDGYIRLLHLCFVERATAADIEDEMGQWTVFLTYDSSDGGAMAAPAAYRSVAGAVGLTAVGSSSSSLLTLWGLLKHRDHR